MPHKKPVRAADIPAVFLIPALLFGYTFSRGAKILDNLGFRLSIQLKQAS
jgi:hypothetical protein